LRLIDEVNMHRLGNSLDALFALIDELQLELVADLMAHGSPNKRFRPASPDLEPRGAASAPDLTVRLSNDRNIGPAELITLPLFGTVEANS
jgi:hypothetical protein